MKILLQTTSSYNLMILTKMVESAGHIGIVKTLNGKEALAEIYCTTDTYQETLDLLEVLPQSIKILSVN